MRTVVREYLTAEGENPFRSWLTALDTTTRARVMRFESGNLGDHKAVGGGVWEARLDFGPGYRLYFGQIGAVFVILLCGGDKSTQSKDIKRAKAYWKEYPKEQDHG